MECFENVIIIKGKTSSQYENIVFAKIGNARTIIITNTSINETVYYKLKSYDENEIIFEITTSNININEWTYIYENLLSISDRTLSEYNGAAISPINISTSTFNDIFDHVYNGNIKGITVEKYKQSDNSMISSFKYTFHYGININNGYQINIGIGENSSSDIVSWDGNCDNLRLFAQSDRYLIAVTNTNKGSNAKVKLTTNSLSSTLIEGISDGKWTYWSAGPGSASITINNRSSPETIYLGAAINPSINVNANNDILTYIVNDTPNISFNVIWYDSGGSIITTCSYTRTITLLETQQINVGVGSSAKSINYSTPNIYR